MDRSLSDANENEAETRRKAQVKAAAKSKRRSRPSTTVHELFRLLDTNGDGVLTLDEVVGAHERLGLSEVEATTLFEGLDVDGSGTLTRAEMSFMGSLTQKIKSASRHSFRPRHTRRGKINTCRSELQLKVFESSLILRCFSSVNCVGKDLQFVELSCSLRRKWRRRQQSCPQPRRAWAPEAGTNPQKAHPAPEPEPTL